MENTIIQASAGTGKTHQLACRYLLLLFSGDGSENKVRPENILATTFTKKAAGEIQSRILTWLAEGALDNEKCTELSKKLSGAKEMTQSADKSAVTLNLDEVRQTLYEVVKSLNRVNISTLDSYFNQRLKCFSLELGLPMDWTIIDDSFDKRRRQMVLSKLFQDEDFLESFALYVNISNLSRSVYDQMSDAINKLYSLWRETPPEVWETLKIPQFKYNDDSFHQLLETTIDFFSCRDTPYTEKGKESIKTDLRRIRDGNPYKVIPEFLGKALLLNTWAVHSAPEQGISFNKHTITDPDIVSCLIDIATYARAFLFKMKRMQSDFYQKKLLTLFDSLYIQDKKDKGELVFSDIPWFLTRQDAADNDSDSFRMDSSVQHLMLDEFQDTSLDQWRVLEPLAKKTTEDNNKSFFCVGDVKQAIYNWRGGEARLLKELRKILLDGLPEETVINEVDIKQSRRSGPAIMTAVNKAFKEQLGQNDLLDKGDGALQTLRSVAVEWSENFPAHDSYHSDMDSYVEMRTAPYETSEDVTAKSDDLRMATYEYAAKMIKTELDEASRKHDLSIGVLVRNNDAGSKIADCIKNEGLECSLEGNSPLLDSYEVRLILALLKWIDHPDDLYSYYQVCSSPLSQELDRLAKALELNDRESVLNVTQRLAVGLDDCKILNQLRYELLYNGYGLTVQRWVNLLKPTADERSRRRLEMLEELANQYDSQGSTRTDAFIDYITDTSLKNVFKTRIRVMTYHQAKGLEFDIVILPQLDTPLVTYDSIPVVYGRPKPYEIEPPDKIIPSFKSEHRYLLPDEELKELFTYDEKRQMQESLCNLYVAMTRPKRALYMILPPYKTGDHHTYEDVLLGTLAKESGVTRKNKQPGKTYYSEGKSEWIQNLLMTENDGQKDEPETSEEIVNVTPDFKFDSGVRSVCVPLPATSWTTDDAPESFIETVTAEVDSSVNSGSYLPQSLRGTLLHCWLADIEWLENYNIDDKRLVDLGIGIGLQQKSFMSLLPSFKSLLNQPAVISALSRPDESWEVYREKNVAGILKEDNARRLVNGVIDRLLLHRSDGKVDKAIVIDFKTVRKGSDLDEVLNRYTGQMDAYRQIVSMMYGIEIG
ncbi:MAG: UvrD-helicase domain-containing protein, partial [Thermoguttaceae bacterium]|nr:UvrD-helicase domain-containing protein [Thermoguttaceae bacterium]